MGTTNNICQTNLLNDFSVSLMCCDKKCLCVCVVLAELLKQLYY